MKKIMKKVTAIVLSLVMVFGCVPTFTNIVDAEPLIYGVKLDSFDDGNEIFQSIVESFNAVGEDGKTYTLIDPSTCQIEVWCDGVKLDSLTVLSKTNDYTVKIIANDSTNFKNSDDSLQEFYDYGNEYAVSVSGITDWQNNGTTFSIDAGVLTITMQLKAKQIHLDGEFVISNLSDDKTVGDLDLSFNLTVGDKIYTLDLFDFNVGNEDVYYSNSSSCNLEESSNGSELIDFGYDYFLSSKNSITFDLKYNGDESYFDETNVDETNEKFEQIVDECLDGELSGIAPLHGGGTDEYTHSFVKYTIFYEPGTLNKSISIRAYLFNDYYYLVENADNSKHDTFTDTSISTIMDLPIVYNYSEGDNNLNELLNFNGVISEIDLKDYSKLSLGYINNDGWFDEGKNKVSGDLYAPICITPDFEAFEAYYDSSKTKVLTNLYKKAYNDILGDYYIDNLTYNWYLFSPITPIEEEINLENNESRNVTVESNTISISYLSDDDKLGLMIADGELQDDYTIDSKIGDEWCKVGLILNFEDDDHPLNSSDKVIIELAEADEDLMFSSLFAGNFDVKTNDHLTYTLTIDSAKILDNCIGITIKKYKNDGPFTIKSIKLCKDYDIVLSDEYIDENIPYGVDCFCEVSLPVNASTSFVASTPIINISKTPTSSGRSRKYKANDNNTAMDVSGSGKKGAKRTITPIEGRKVKEVLVKDKKDNLVEVTMNEDGTFEFIQPASDVNIEIIYADREMKLELGTINVTLDGEAVPTDASLIVNSNNEKLVPIRVVAENLGGSVKWSENAPNSIGLVKGDKVVDITLGNRTVKVNGEEVELSVAPIALNNRTYLPVDFYKEVLDLYVESYNDQMREYLRLIEQ